MIKVIPCPKTYEISEEKIPCLPLRIFTEEEDFLPACDVLEEAFRKLYGKAHPGPVSEKQDTLPPHGDFGLPVRRLFECL